MGTSRKSSLVALKDVVNSAELLGLSGIFTIADPEEWVVRPEKIREALQTHSSCIPSATSEWSQTVPIPMSWAGWWLNRMTHGLERCKCGTAGGSSKRTG